MKPSWLQYTEISSAVGRILRFDTDVAHKAPTQCGHICVDRGAWCSCERES